MQLPSGMELLLEIAAGLEEPTARVATITGQSRRRLRHAALFFVEQVLLAPDTDPYRTLGAMSDTPDATLRRHMALMMRCVHPDAAAARASDPAMSQHAVFAERVTAAWEAMKTPARRANITRANSSRPVNGRHDSGQRAPLNGTADPIRPHSADRVRWLQPSQRGTRAVAPSVGRAHHGMARGWLPRVLAWLRWPR